MESENEKFNGYNTEQSSGVAVNPWVMQAPSGIYTALANVMRTTGAIGKDGYNPMQKFKFRGIDAVMNTLHSDFAREGVIILPQAIGDPKITERKTANGGTIYHFIQRWRFTFCASDGSSVSSEFLGEAADSGDKALSKTASIALKYALFQMLLIPTEEVAQSDPDQYSPNLQGGCTLANPSPRVAYEEEQIDASIRAGELKERNKLSNVQQWSDGLKSPLKACKAKEDFSKHKADAIEYFGELPEMIKNQLDTAFKVWSKGQLTLTTEQK
jgi:hypothetical protein